MTAQVWPSVMVTGHRPQHLPTGTEDWVRGELDRLAVKLRDHHGLTTGITGMALGADMWWAQSLHLAEVPYVAHIPFPQQPDAWHRNPEAVAEWHRLRNLADRDREVVYGDLAGLAEHARKRVAVKLLHKRNDGMLSATASAGGAVVAVWCPSKRDGGTYSALEKAHRADLPVIHINPEARTVTLPSRAGLARLLTTTIVRLWHCNAHLCEATAPENTEGWTNAIYTHGCPSHGAVIDAHRASISHETRGRGSRETTTWFLRCACGWAPSMPAWSRHTARPLHEQHLAHVLDQKPA